ncbi:MBL fold metallo-hydrolase [Phytohabitans flavus]|uniref:MBL fold metallo-hydrolase n=1 Tax=Phytohabitans flavus TaxID=1076124 RepID=UPI0036384990
MSLSYDTRVSMPPRSVLPDGTSVGRFPSWSPITSTLILGDREAVLVDAPHTVQRAAEVADWVEASGRDLVAMYATHGHGDHYFGFTEVARRFPRSRLLGTAGTVSLALEQASSPLWRTLFPGQIPDDIRPLEVVDGPVFDLEGHEIRFAEAGHSDIRDTTFVHVPELALVVGGDIVYNEVHVHASDSDQAQRREWTAALDRIAALNPVAVIAGHKKPGNDDGPHVAEETKAYLRDTDEACTVARSPEEFVDLMLQRHLSRMNPNVLWDNARKLVPA